MRWYRLSNLDLTNQTLKDSTSVTLASAYNPNDKIKIIKEHELRRCAPLKDIKFEI